MSDSSLHGKTKNGLGFSETEFYVSRPILYLILALYDVMITGEFHMYSIWCAKDMEAAFLAIHYNIIIGFERLWFSLRLPLGIQQFRLRTQLPVKALCTDPYLGKAVNMSKSFSRIQEI